MEIQKYSSLARGTDALHANGRALAVRKYGLYGQVGGLLTLVKKESREAQFQSHRDDLLEEVGDILWYVSAVADQLGQSLADLFSRALTNSSEITSFEEADDSLKADSQEHSLDTALHSLASSAGELLCPNLAEPNHAEKLVNVIRALAVASFALGLPLAAAAAFNLRKIQARWPGSAPVYAARLDTNAKPFEQFPREMQFEFRQRQLNEQDFVYISVRGINVGDRLTDNRDVSDGYRFHDVFHIANAVHLGWSPVLRALLKLKRKSDPVTDENQDGARAIIIEEGISTWIFNHAARAENNYYARVETGQLPYRLLKQVSGMVDGYEVADLPLWQWERAILDGFKVFRQLRDHNGGIITAFFDEHRMEFTPLSEISDEA